jgi:light-regulated signal transduction histidine kinase (bacteriophytochrome)
MKKTIPQFDEVHAIIKQTEDTIDAIYKGSNDFVEPPLPLNFRVLKEAVRESERLQEKHDQLARLYDELESYSFALSNIVRSPLRRINSYANILAEEDGKNGADKMVSAIIKNTKELNHQFDCFIDLINLSRKVLRKKSVSVQNIISAIYKNEFSQAVSSQLHLTEMRDTEAEPELAERVIREILCNSFRFRKKKGRLQINAGWDEEKHAYFIEDNGIGFPPEYAESVFDLFKRLNKEDEYPGAGTGLTAVKKIIALHRGKVWIEAASGIGCTVFFAFKRKDDDN